MALENGTYSPDFSHGTWIEAKQEGGEEVVGMVINFDPDDGQYSLVIPPGTEADVHAWDIEWVLHEPTKRCDPPQGIFGPRYAFILNHDPALVGDGDPPYEAFATLDALAAHYGDDVETAALAREVGAQAVADPHTLVHFPDSDSTICFALVKSDK